MRRSIPGLVIGAALALAAPSPADAQPVALRLCTASATGNYHAAGELIAKALDAGKVALELVETDGSWENLEAMAAGACNGAIVQVDAYLTFREEHNRSVLDITRPEHLYDEYVHLICNAAARVDSLAYMKSAVGGPTLLVGQPQSGHATTWRFIRLLGLGYGDVAYEEVGGEDAAQRLGTQTPACLLQVSGLRSKFLAGLDKAPPDLRLVPVQDPELLDAKISGLEVYGEATIPADVYPNLQAGAPVKTLSVSARLIVDSAWADANGAAFDALRAAVSRALPAIRERVQTR